MEKKSFWNNSRAGMYAGLFVLFSALEVAMVFAGRRGLSLSPFEIVLLMFAGSLLGCAVSYMTIGKPIRDIFGVVVPHPSGIGDYIEPKCNSGFLGAFCELICCPICSATWMCGALLFLIAFTGSENYLPVSIGKMDLYLFAGAGGARVITYISEMLEWKKAEAWENAGYTRTLNKEAQKLKVRHL